MNNIKYIFLLVLFACGTNSQDASIDVAQNTLEKDLVKYESIWNRFLAGDTSVANENNFYCKIRFLLTIPLSVSNSNK